MSLLTAEELAAFADGQHSTLYCVLGSHPDPGGCSFALWAPEARAVRVVGEFAPRGQALNKRRSGVWTGRVRSARTGQWYRYEVTTQRGEIEQRVDPFAISFRDPAAPEAIISAPARRWQDGAWMRTRERRQAADRPLSIYEVHLGSWRRSANGDFLGYRQAARELAEHVAEMGFTHVEFLPLSEHPFYGSWGYQATGFFAPTARYGSPTDLMAAVDTFHRAGIGVILDWVPSHFASDHHGLARFTGQALFEHDDPRKGFHPDWNSPVFNHEVGEVKSFLLSSARWWLERFHLDGLRVDAVASMLYLDYSRADGEWEPNQYGGRENLAALEFLRALNAMVKAEFPGALVIAEESTAWPGVTRPHYLGGLGFDLKWDMGWMNDTLRYMAKDPVYRRYQHDLLTFGLLYAFTENFCLPLSHDEVVHGKGSLLDQMPGDMWQRFANLRLLYSYMWTHPGKKLLFMGGELAQWNEWNCEADLQWDLLEWDTHRGVQRLVADLNQVYRNEPSLHEVEFQAEGFEWVDCMSREDSVLCYMRKAKRPEDYVLICCNFTPVVRRDYRVGMPQEGRYATIFNSDSHHYGGSNVGGEAVHSEPVPHHGRPCSAPVTLPPLGVLILKPQSA